MKQNIILIVTIFLTVNVLIAQENNDEVVGWRHNWYGEFPDADPPTDFDTEKNVIWKVKTDNWSNASPVIVGDRIFICEEPWTLVCLSKKDGSLLWRRTRHALEDVFKGEQLKAYLEFQKDEGTCRADKKRWTDAVAKSNRLRKMVLRGKGTPETKVEAEKALKESLRLKEEFKTKWGMFVIPRKNRLTGYSSTTPVSDGKNIYAFYGNDVLCSYTLDGTQNWARRVGSGSHSYHNYGRVMSPWIIDGKLVLQVDLDEVYAFDLENGKQLWNCPVKDETWATPAPGVIDSLPIVVCGYGDVVRVTDGKNLLRIEDYRNKRSMGVFKGNILYVSDFLGRRWARAYEFKRAGNSVEVKMLWQSPDPPNLKGGGFTAGVLVHDGLLYRVSSRSSILMVHDIQTGEVVYQKNLDIKRGVELYPSPTLIGDNIFVAGEDGHIFIFKKGREYKPVSEIRFEKFRSSPVAIGNRLYIRGSEYMYCIGKK